MSKEFLEFGGIKIEKRTFHSSKRPMITEDVDIDKIVISEEFAYGKIGKNWKIGKNGKKGSQVFHQL